MELRRTLFTIVSSLMKGVVDVNIRLMEPLARPDNVALAKNTPGK